MAKIKIFTAKNVQQYGFTEREIDELNAEWEQKAAELGLEEHIPQYWQEAKHYMGKKLEGWDAESRDEIETKPLNEEPVELPSLDVDLDDLDIVDDAAVELPELESISLEDIDTEVVSEEQDISAEEGTDEFAAAEDEELEEKETIEEQIISVEESAEEIAEESVAEEEPVPDDTLDLQPAETDLMPEAAVRESEEELNSEKAASPIEDQKKESFLGKIICRLKKIFTG